MKVELKISSKSYSVDLSNPLDISIPLNFNGDQPNPYDVPVAAAKAYEDGQFIGDTRKGGGCNFEELKLIPHCNGTHTECVGHISYERISICSVLKNSFIPATLITVKPVSAAETTETYKPAIKQEDNLITRSLLSEALETSPKEFQEGLIIRTLPNPESKMTRKYMAEPPPYFSIEAMQSIVELGVRHLLVDIPSVDRPFDEGKMTAHHIFWNVPEESHEVDPQNHSMKTITEMIYVANEVEDGRYFLNLQIPNFMADAAPSRPVIYQLKESTL